MVFFPLFPCISRQEVKVLEVDVDEVVDILFDNSQMAMTHPFHSHGHKFWVLGMAGKDEELALTEINPMKEDAVRSCGRNEDFISMMDNAWSSQFVKQLVDQESKRSSNSRSEFKDASSASTPSHPISLFTAVVAGVFGSNDNLISMMMMDSTWSSQFVKQLVDPDSKRSISSGSEIEDASSASVRLISVTVFVAVVVGVLCHW
jgi:hypothetical protein